jgi:hypothetical protein
MRFKIPFNENVYREQMLLNFEQTWKKHWTANKRRLFWTIPMFFMGALLINGENYFGYVLIGFGVHYLTNFFDYYLHYKKSKKKYSDLVESEISGHKTAEIDILWEFNEEYFSYKDYKYESKMKWNVFKSYRVIDSNLFMDINVGPYLSYVLAEKEIGKDQFKQVIDFIKTKIG